MRVVVLSIRSLILAKKLYVGNLTYNVDESDLEALFTPFGTVQSAQIIVDRDTNRSKGFGFVEMDTDAQAQAAIQGLNGHEHDGRNLTVNEAKPREARAGGGGGVWRRWSWGWWVRRRWQPLLIDPPEQRSSRGLLVQAPHPPWRNETSPWRASH